MGKKAGYKPATPDINKVVAKVMNECYPELTGAKIKTILHMGTRIVNGKVISASIKPVNEKERISGVNADILLVITFDIWGGLSEEGQEALVDHEFGHIKKLDNDGVISYKSRKHDVEEFVATVERRGNWSMELEDLELAMKKKHAADNIQKSKSTK